MIHWQSHSRKLLIQKDFCPEPLAHQGLLDEDFDGIAAGTDERFALGPLNRNRIATAIPSVTVEIDLES